MQRGYEIMKCDCEQGFEGQLGPRVPVRQGWLKAFNPTRHRPDSPFKGDLPTFDLKPTCLKLERSPMRNSTAIEIETTECDDC
ncbi:hypothetical protein PGTUg99_030083 [Puccinia graminis f. sp. tritici]|uniref:Uncharacterized protein n=1 Tax=Puccinia graminis f. sp. tritici TaxID=56615 RepID=A0A5B0MCP5_PUCGR|nr:hypothetical protein PGTUg99_030083 [Puccinia graminis f. sp. tritici]